MSDAVLSIRDLAVSFPSSNGARALAVDGFSLDLYPGTLTAVVGESGSGKSVSAMTMLGLVPSPPARVERGEIRYLDRDGTTVDLLGASNRVLRSISGADIAMIFQEPMTSLNPVLTIGAQVVEAIRLHRPMSKGAARRLAAELLDRVGISEASSRLRQYPHEFSGGMRQRVMIAMALACGPRVLIADEPTTALDVTIQASILSLIGDLVREDGLSVMLITHDLALVGERADRVAVMYRGHLLEAGACGAVRDRPAHPYTRGLLATVPELGASRPRLATLGEALRDESARTVVVDGHPRLAWTPGVHKGAHEMVPVGADHAVRVAVEGRGVSEQRVSGKVGQSASTGEGP